MLEFNIPNVCYFVTHFGEHLFSQHQLKYFIKPYLLYLVPGCRLLRSQGAVQYFRSVHTELRNKINFLSFVNGFNICPWAERSLSKSYTASRS